MLKSHGYITLVILSLVSTYFCSFLFSLDAHEYTVECVYRTSGCFLLSPKSVDCTFGFTDASSRSCIITSKGWMAARVSGCSCPTTFSSPGTCLIISIGSLCLPSFLRERAKL